MTNLVNPQAEAVSQSAVVRDDRILPETRWIGACIPPFLFIAFVLLYFFPYDGVALNGTPLFAWKINPPMTPMIMAAGYISGAYFFVRLIMSKRWHPFTNGVPAIAAFTWFMGLSTVLHWDRFLHNHVSFYAWFGLYVLTPFIVPFLWLRNRKTDPGTPDPDDAVVPERVRMATTVIGVGMVALGLLMFIVPDVVIGLWPWNLTPLTARVVGGWFVLPGVMALFLGRDPRWSSWRILLESQVIAFVLILIAVVRAWDNFTAGNPMTWVFIGSLALLLVGTVALYFIMENRRRAVTR